jgi:hypothetical protein
MKQPSAKELADAKSTHHSHIRMAKTQKNLNSGSGRRAVETAPTGMKPAATGAEILMLAASVTADFVFLAAT